VRCNIARVLLAVTAAAAVAVVPAAATHAQDSVLASAPAPQLSDPGPAVPPPGPPPDCKNHPSFPGCKKKPAGASPTPKP